ncbi:hypothetical protein G3I59_20885 [Amycolatopsis rubida]|uniref:Uncharacterized protein n=1 Tax=Amycolatopsis rubida TaxID=112413 RepID=A0ABX0BR32_9PSEU|nr:MULTISPECIES: hypothetical protein [Amycolatopsis]MYW93003.1 hypothetical protein [Amycolatopsis rubida]NEC57990.1 hypothetical protein [Amycolatopsis rubida]
MIDIRKNIPRSGRGDETPHRRAARGTPAGTVPVVSAGRGNGSRSEAKSLKRTIVATGPLSQNQTHRDISSRPAWIIATFRDVSAGPFWTSPKRAPGNNERRFYDREILAADRFPRTFLWRYANDDRRGTCL